MLNYDGFRLIKVLNGVHDTFVAPYAIINYQPETKYKINKTNAFDPTIVIKRGAYFDDKIEIEAFLIASELQELYSILANFDKLYIEFDANKKTMQLPVIIENKPKLEDKARYHKTKIKFSLKALYKSHTRIDFDNLFGFGLSWNSNFGF